MFPILVSHLDITGTLRTSRSHTALHGNFFIRMAAVSAQQPGMGNHTGMADNTQENTEQEVILIQEYCERGIQNQSDEKIL